MICMCNIGHQPSQDYMECHRVVELYRSCADEKSRCRGPLTYCERFSKTCLCIDGYIPASDNIRCKKMPRYGIAFAVMGESCKKGSTECQDTDQQVCSAETSKCTCREGWKPASNIDLNAEPFILDECRPADFSLEVELKECTKPVIIGIALIRDTCITNNNCPDNSKCKQMGCDRRECRCVNGTAPTANMESCKPAVTLHHTCNSSVVCLGAYVGCIQGKCSCSRGAVEAIDGQCKSAPLIPGKVEFAALGEKCDDGKKSKIMKLCESAICRKGICHCPESMREMSLAEKLENPDVSPPCISINELIEELSPAEYKLKCQKNKHTSSRLRHTGIKPDVTASWPEEPRKPSIRTSTEENPELSTFAAIKHKLKLPKFAIAEDNQETSEIKVNQTVTIEANATDTNSSVNLFEILVGKPSNDTEEIVDRLSSLDESLKDELRNVSLELTSANESSPANNSVNLDGLNNTLNFLLTNDFDAADFNESFDADYLSDDYLETPGNKSSENRTIESNVLDTNSTVDLFEILVGKRVNDTEELIDLLSSLNGSISDELLNVSMGLMSANESLVSDINVDLNDLNGTLNFLLTNDFDTADFNESFDAEFLPDRNFTFDLGNETSLNDSFNLGSLNGTSLNESLDLALLNVSSLNKSLDLKFSNGSRLNKSLNLNSLNGTSLNGSLDLEFLNGTNLNGSLNLDSLNGTSLNGSLDLESLNGTSLNGSLDLESLNGTSLNGSLDLESLNGTSLNGSLDLESLNGTSLNGSLDLESLNGTSLNGSLDLESLNGTSLNGSLDLESLNGTSLNGSLDLESLNGTSLNGSLDWESLNGTSLNGSLDLESLNGTSLNGSLDLESLNGTSLNGSLDLESLNGTSLNGSLDLESLNGTSLNGSLDLESLNGTSLNGSLDLESLNGTSLNGSLDLESLNGTSLNGSLNLDYLNDTSLNKSQPLISSKSKSANVSTIKSCELLLNNSDNEKVSNISSTKTPNMNKTTTERNQSSVNESKSLSINETAQTNKTNLLNTTNALMDNGTVEAEFESTSLNDTLELGPLNETLFNDTTGKVIGNKLDVANVTGTPNTTGMSATLSKDGGMEAALLDDSPDLGLELAADDSHFIGSSGDEIKPVTYNDSADEDVAEVAEIVSERNFTNRMVLEKCDINDVCPTLSQCLDVGCGDPVCFCIYPYGPSEDRLRCIAESNPPESCEQLSNFQNIKDDTSSVDTVPVVVATTLVCLGLVLVLVVIFIYARLNL